MPKKLPRELRSEFKLEVTCFSGEAGDVEKIHDIACAGRIQYTVLERASDYVLNMIDGLWVFCSDMGDDLMEVAQESLDAQQAFRQILDKGWEELV